MTQPASTPPPPTPVQDERHERASELRHGLRNRLFAVRSAMFYLERRVQRTSLWEEDPRVRRFFELITTEIVAADKTIARVSVDYVLDGTEPDDGDG